MSIKKTWQGYQVIFKSFYAINQSLLWILVLDSILTQHVANIMIKLDRDVKLFSSRSMLLIKPYYEF